MSSVYAMRRRRRSQMASNAEGQADDDDAVVVSTTNATCIDLTDDTVGEEIIDLTSGHGIMDSPVVVLSPSDDVGPIRRRRGSGRLGQRRRSSSRRGRSAGTAARRLATSSNEAAASSSQILPLGDSDSDELPDLPFQISEPANQSALASPEGVKIACPVCFDDVTKIKRQHKQLMSTVCGHIFCNVCIFTALNHQKLCPTCRKKLTPRSVHPVFV